MGSRHMLARFLFCPLPIACCSETTSTLESNESFLSRLAKFEVVMFAIWQITRNASENTFSLSYGGRRASLSYNGQRCHFRAFLQQQFAWQEWGDCICISMWLGLSMCSSTMAILSDGWTLGESMSYHITHITCSAKAILSGPTLS